MTAAVGAGRLLWQVVCAPLVFISDPLKIGWESASEVQNLTVASVSSGWNGIGPTPPPAPLNQTALTTFLRFCLQQSTGDTPTTPKYTKEHRDLFFPASLPTPVLVSHSACHPLPGQDGLPRAAGEPLSKMSRPQSSGFHDHQQQQRRAGGQSAAANTFLPPAGTVT